MTDTVLLCLKVFIHFQQHFYAVDLIFRSEENQLLNLVSPSVFDEIKHIEIDVTKVNNIVFFYVLHIVEIEYELVNIITTEYDIKDIVNEINANYNLKSAVETVVKSSHIKLFINFVKVSVIHVKLLLELKSNAVRGQSVKEFRQDNKPVLMSLRK